MLTATVVETSQGYVTEMLYEHEGVQKCARQTGRMNRAEALGWLARIRERTSKLEASNDGQG